MLPSPGPLLLDERLHFRESLEAQPPVLFEFLDPLPYFLLLQQPLNELLVVLGGVEPGEGLHHVVNFLLLLCPLFIQFALLLEVEQVALYHKLLPFNALVDAEVVYLKKPLLYLLLLLGVVVVELHLRQQKLGVVIIFDLEVASQRHVPHYLASLVGVRQ